MARKKHINQVIVGNAYNTEEYYYPIAGKRDVARYFTTGEKVSIAYHMIMPGKKPKEHSHIHEQALLVPQGDGTVLINGKEYSAEPGFFAIIPPEIPHTYVSEMATHLSWNMDIFTPARLEYDRETYYQLLAEGKNPYDTIITE